MKARRASARSLEEVVTRLSAALSAAEPEKAPNGRRAERFVLYACEFGHSLQLALAAGGETADAEPADHFHLTHEDIGFELEADGRVLAIDACQGEVRVRRLGRHGGEGRLTLPSLSAANARRLVLDFVAIPAGDLRLSEPFRIRPGPRDPGSTWPR